MKKLWLPFLLLTACISVFTACKKNAAEENYTEIVNPVIPDFTTQVTAAVNGFITDENGNALAGASVKAGTVIVATDQFGYFTISSAAFAKSAGFVQVSKSNYFTGYRTFLPVAGKETFIRLQLIPKTTAGTLDASAGGTVTTTDGAVVTLPANGVVVAANNTAYTGTVNVAAHWLDPTAEETTHTMPGNLTGVDSAGHFYALVTYGMLGVELTGSSGEALQIASGKKASLHFPLPASLSGTAPASIPLWYFDETKGVWKQEGVAIKSGNSYEGDVSHFTFWNVDVNLPLVNFSLQVVDNDLRPVVNAAVGVSFASRETGARIAYTDANGEITGMVPANSDLSIEIVALCSQKISIKNIHTTTSDIDLGAVKVDLQQYGAIFKGTANKCSGTPVTDGFVVIKESGVFHSINIQNGVFNSTITICPNANTTVTIIDMEATQQSNPRNIVAVNGINDLGTLSACIPLTGEYFIYELDGVTSLITLPEHQFEGDYFIANNLTQISATNLITGYRSVGFDLVGADTAGNHVINNSIMDFCPLNSVNGNNTPFIFVNPTTVTISQYGLIGQFVKGSYSGTVQAQDNTFHTLNFTFNIKREH